MSRRTIGVVLSAVLLIGACAPAVPVPTPGQLLYVTTFDAFNEDWELYNGELAARIAIGDAGPALEIAVDTPQAGAFTVMKQEFGDFDAIVEARQVAGPHDIDAPGYGLLFRHRDAENFYAFMISSDGYYQVVRRLDGIDEVISDWALTDIIHQGDAVNTIRVVAKGDQFVFLINDIQVPLCLTIWNPLVPGECQVPASDQTAEPAWSTDAVTFTLEDTALAQGRLGVGARSFSQGGIRVQFDNLLVCGPYESPAVPFRCEEQVATE